MTGNMCRVCILTDAIPGITLNADGICHLCEEHLSRRRQHAEITYKTDDDLVKALRGGRNTYDCLCLYSGGKDSSYMLHYLAARLRLRVLAVTLDNWFLSPQTLQNIRTTLQRLQSVDHVFVKPAWSQVQKTFQAGFALKAGTELGEKAFLLGHACFSCFGLISLYAVKIAIEKGIRNIVVGTTPGQLTQKNIRDLRQKYRTPSEAFQAIAVPLMRQLGREDPELRRAFHLSVVQKLRIAALRLVPFYEFIRYDESMVYRVVEKELGWIRPRDTDSCSTNCQVNALGVFVHRKKYGVSPYAIPLAHDVRIGLMTREEALAQVNGELNMGIVRKIAVQLGVPREVEEDVSVPAATARAGS